MNWKAWYTDNRVYTSEGTQPENLPKDGALRLNVYDSATESDYSQRDSGDFYFFQGDIIGYGHTAEYTQELTGGMTIEQAVQTRYPGAIVVLGQWVTDEEMGRVHKEADEARTWP